MSPIKRCSNCHEYYENTMEGLTEHMYGDNPYARNCQEISGNTISVERTFSGNWLERFFKSFRTPKIERSAHQELLDYKIKMCEKLTSDPNEL